VNPIELLTWYVEAGVDEAIGEAPVDRYAASKAPPKPAEAPRAAASMPAPAMPAIAAPRLDPAAEIAGTAAHMAAQCRTLDELKAALEAFEHPLKKGGARTVFADGNPAAPLMIVGEAPGFDEDRVGLPFVGVSGKLLDRMLASIGRDRSSAYITNILFWRPPGNRTPEIGDVQACLPFVTRHIELVGPQAILLVGGASAKALLGRTEGIGQLRGQWHDIPAPALGRPVPALATYHPAFLLRTPEMKGAAWRDLLTLTERLPPAG
jgi:DNA polymerase